MKIECVGFVLIKGGTVNFRQTYALVPGPNQGMLRHFGGVLLASGAGRATLGKLGVTIGENGLLRWHSNGAELRDVAEWFMGSNKEREHTPEGPLGRSLYAHHLSDAATVQVIALRSEGFAWHRQPNGDTTTLAQVWRANPDDATTGKIWKACDDRKHPARWVSESEIGNGRTEDGVLIDPITQESTFNIRENLL